MNNTTSKPLNNKNNNMEYAYTPKEKAKELFDKYHLSFAGIVSFDDDWEALAKQCALISVDETLEALNENQWQNRNQIAYYKEVELEIKKL
jgi:hypothetical protein